MFRATLLWAALVATAIGFGCRAADTHPVEGDWTTVFERSGGKETCRYVETVAFCKRLAEADSISEEE